MSSPKKEIIKNNTIIAEFMTTDEGKEWKTPNGSCITHQCDHEGKRCVIIFDEEDAEWMQYNSSWDWLIPVVEKIESLGFKFEIWKNNYSIQQFQENTEEYIEMLYQYGYFKRTKQEAVYQGVIEFIKDYNSKN